MGCPSAHHSKKNREQNRNALSLRLNAIDYSLREVVARCHDYVVSPYLIHSFRATSQAERGAQVKSNMITMNFSKARDKAVIEWGMEHQPLPMNNAL